MSLRFLIGCSLLLLLTTGKVFGQKRVHPVYYEEVQCEKFDELRRAYGKEKVLPGAYELSCLVALSRYPELKETSITFVKKRIRTTMAARPLPWSVFRKPGERQYRIFINTSSELEGALLSDLSFNERIGVIAHELAHVLDYERRSGGELIGYGVNYLFSKRFKADLEKKTDSLAVSRGFGWQVHAFTDHLHHCSGVSEEYLDYKKAHYYMPFDILMILARSSRYSLEMQDIVEQKVTGDDSVHWEEQESQ